MTLDVRAGIVGYAVIYSAFTLVMVVDLVVAIWVINAQASDGTTWPSGVFTVEMVGLVIFALFFLVQTLQHRHDGDGWGKLPPPPKKFEAALANEADGTGSQRSDPSRRNDRVAIVHRNRDRGPR